MYRLLVWGDWACFPRPEFGTDLISYEIMTPLAAKGILEAIHWRPAIRWSISTIMAVKAPDCLGTRSQLEAVSHSAEQVRLLALHAVTYVIEADFELTAAAGDRDSMAAHRRMFEERVRKNRPFRRPYFGLRGCPAEFRLLAPDEPWPACPDDLRGSFDWGWLMFDQENERARPTRYFRARSVDGKIAVPPPDSPLLYG